MKQSLESQIRACIESALRNSSAKTEIVIYPFGEVGRLVSNILFQVYGIKKSVCVDNRICKYNEDIKSVDYLKSVDWNDRWLIVASTNDEIYKDLLSYVKQYVIEDRIIELECMKKWNQDENTIVGRHSYGCLCNNPMVERIGNFCSFASGCSVTCNHAVDYLSTSPFIYHDCILNPGLIGKYTDRKGEPWYIEGIKPKGKVRKLKRITIGNDVWLATNVLITNGADIGNGVIAGAGAIITKDVPDYAVVGGVPAKIIRYRYSKSEIEALNRIKWWDWTDDEIRKRYDDFFLPIGEFIAKYR